MALLERFYDPVAAAVDRGDKGEEERIEIVIDGKLNDSNGVVLVDGVDIRKMDVKYLRNAVALVGQEPVLFDASVRENIAFGKDGASEEEIISAAKTANAHDFISKFHNGYDYNAMTCCFHNRANARGSVLPNAHIASSSHKKYQIASPHVRSI